MKNLLIIAALFLVGCTKVEPGYVGIKVNQYGTQKGVDDFPLHTGAVWFNPFTTDVYKFPTFRQNVVWTKNPHEGNEQDESITFNSVEGSVINADISVSYSIKVEQVPNVFVTFRKDLDHITLIYVRSEVRDAFSRHGSNMRVVDIFGKDKQKLLESVKSDLNANLGKIGFDFEMVSFIGGLRCEPKVMASINATIEATQLAISAQNKIVQAKAEADQAIETARGQAESILAVAKAQAQANDIVNKSLTGDLIRYKMIERWSGTPPQVIGGEFSTLLNITKQ